MIFVQFYTYLLGCFCVQKKSEKKLIPHKKKIGKINVSFKKYQYYFQKYEVMNFFHDFWGLQS